MWFKQVLRLTMCNKGLRKLLNCNSYTSANKTCKVVVELHITYTLNMVRYYAIDDNREIFNVTTEWVCSRSCGQAVLGRVLTADSFAFLACRAG